MLREHLFFLVYCFIDDYVKLAQKIKNERVLQQFYFALVPIFSILYDSALTVTPEGDCTFWLR